MNEAGITITPTSQIKNLSLWAVEVTLLVSGTVGV
jgi:hypothetical protein